MEQITKLSFRVYDEAKSFLMGCMIFGFLLGGVFVALSIYERALFHHSWVDISVAILFSIGAWKFGRDYS